MLAFGGLLVPIGLAIPRLDTLPPSPANDSVAAVTSAADPVLPGIHRSGSVDSAQGRPKVVELSDWYYRRLTIHRWVAWGALPVFAAQWAAGQRLYDASREAPTWAKTTHRVGATVLAAGFTANTVTGVWNLWDSRSVKRGRALRTIHGISMLITDGMFTYAGAKLSDEAEQSAGGRRRRRAGARAAGGRAAGGGGAGGRG